MPALVNTETENGKTTASPMTLKEIIKIFPSTPKSSGTCSRRIPNVAEPNLVGSSPFSARSYILHKVSMKRLYMTFIETG